MVGFRFLNLTQFTRYCADFYAKSEFVEGFLQTQKYHFGQGTSLVFISEFLSICLELKKKGELTIKGRQERITAEEIRKDCYDCIINDQQSNSLMRLFESEKGEPCAHK